MRAGQMRHPIHFLKEERTKNEYGETIEKLKIDFPSRAEIISDELNKNIVSDGAEHKRDVKLRVRKNSRITMSHSIRLKGDDLEIESIFDEEKNRTCLINAVKYL